MNPSFFVPCVARRSYHSSSGSHSGSPRSPTSRRHTHSKKHKKELSSYYNNSVGRDKYQDKHATSDGRYVSDKYSERYYDKHDRHSSSSGGKYDPKYDAYNYREYRDKDLSSHPKDYRDSSSKDHKHSTGSKRHDVSFSPSAARGERAWSRSPERAGERVGAARNSHKKSAYKAKDKYRSRSQSPLAHDRHRSSKKHNGRSKERYSRR